MNLFALEHCSTLGDLFSFSFRTLALEIYPVQLFTQITQSALTLFEIRACLAEICADLFLMLCVNTESCLGGAERCLEIGELCRCPLQLTADSTRERVPFAALFLGALSSRHRVAQSLFGNRHLAAELLRALALIGNQSGELGTTSFGSRALGEGRISLYLGDAKALLCRGDLGPQRSDPLLEASQLAKPGRHFAGRVGDFESEAARHQLAVTLSTLALTRQRPNLALYLRDEIVDARKVCRRFLQATLGATLPVAIKPDTRRLLE